MDSQEGARLSELLSEAISSKVAQHRREEQQQVDALLASQKHLTSNLRTLINSLDTILQLPTPRYSSSQGDLVSSCLNRARTTGTKLEQVAARLARVQDHIEQQEAAYGLHQPAAQEGAAPGTTAAEGTGTLRTAAAEGAVTAAATAENVETTAAAGGIAAATLADAPRQQQQQQQQQLSASAVQPASGG